VISSKTIPHPENRKLMFGHFLRMHQNCPSESNWEHSEHADYLRKEATFRVVNTALFLELEERGGPEKVLALEYEGWEKVKKEILEKVRESLKKLRNKLDQIDFVVAADEEKIAEKEKVVAELNNEGHQQIMKVFEEVSPH
jgi:hypothetical protein